MTRGEGERAGGEAAAGSGEGDVPCEPNAEPPAETVAAEDDEEDLGDEDSAEEDEDDEDDEDDDEAEYAWLSEASEDSSDGEFIEDDEEDEDDAFEDEPSDFDDDAMHFEIEGDVDFVHDEPDDDADPDAADADRSANPPREGALRPPSLRTNPRDALEERGCYLLPDGEPIPSSTGMNHRQGADSVGAASPGRLLVTGAKDVRLLDADESSPTRGQVLASTEELPFDVYSVTYDAESSLVAVCGAAGRDGDINLAVFKVAPGAEAGEGELLRDANEPTSGQTAGVVSARTNSAMFVRVADCGVGATGRYHEREMLNCVRFGKLRDGADPAAPPRAVLLCASQDGRCYVYALDVKNDAGSGGAGFDGFEGAREGTVRDAPAFAALSRSSESDGGQGGRGPRRRPRLDARLALATTIELPVACNAAASSPDGAFAACVGDFESVVLCGDRTYGYDAEAHRARAGARDGADGDATTEGSDAFTRHLPIDGDARSAGVVHGEPEGGMYVAWSGDSRYVAATTDSMCVCAVWRVGERANETTRVAYLYNHAHPCLPVTFLPSDPSVVVWAERGGRVHAYDLRRAEARLRGARSENALEAVDMSPPKSRGGSARGGVSAAEAEDALMYMLRDIPGFEESLDEAGGGASSGRVPALTEARVASMDSEQRRARVEEAKREKAALVRRLQNWSENEGDQQDGHRGQIRVLRELHRLATELEMLGGKTGAAERRFVQTIRRRVRGVYVTGVCAVTAPAPPVSKATTTALGPASLRTRPPPHDLVFVGVPSGVLRFRAPTAWLPDYNHCDFPAAFRAAARAFLLCAEADTRRGRAGVPPALEGNREGGVSSVSLGDMPREVLLRVLALAAAPISDWIDASAAGA